MGRGRAQGFAYLLTDPDAEISDATRARLGTLEAFDRLGAGFAISARDLDMRGSGDLLGDDQAGHIKLIGSALYQSLLERAVRQARGEAVTNSLAAPRIDPAAGFPETYIPDPTTRINLYARLARITSSAEADALEDEIADRFGPLPDETTALLDETRISALAIEAGVINIVVGPKATALTVADDQLRAAVAKVPASGSRKWIENRLVLETADGTSHENAFLASILTELAARARPGSDEGSDAIAGSPKSRQPVWTRPSGRFRSAEKEQRRRSVATDAMSRTTQLGHRRARRSGDTSVRIRPPCEGRPGGSQQSFEDATSH